MTRPEQQSGGQVDAAFHDGVILALQVLTSAGDMGDAHYEELVKCCGLANLVKRAKAEGMLELSGLADYRRQLRRQGRTEPLS